MGQNTRKPRIHQARRTLAEVKSAFIHELISKAGGLALDRIMIQARGTCTRSEVSKAVEALCSSGAVRVELRSGAIHLRPAKPATRPAKSKATSSGRNGR